MISINNIFYVIIRCSTKGNKFAYEFLWWHMVLPTGAVYIWDSLWEMSNLESVKQFLSYLLA